MTITPKSEREQYITGLRTLAAALEADETLPLPQSEISWPVQIYDDETYAADDAAVKVVLAKIARLMDGPAIKNYGDEYFRMRGSIGGLQIRPWAMRDQVCTRVVKGTKEVTAEVPVTFTTVTTTVEDVEWVCEPLLAAEVAT